MSELSKKSPNSPSIVRTSFLSYLRGIFPYKHPWIHPCTKVAIPHELIHRRLLELKRIDPKGYDAFWLLWTSQGTRTYTADKLHCSPSTVKRLWNESIDKLLLMLLFPELVPEVFFLNGYES